MSQEQNGSDNIARMSPIKIGKVAFGLRFNPRYAIMDQVGEVVDKILRTKGTPFGSEAFPESLVTTGDATLLNQENGDYLRISTRDVILQMTLGAKSLTSIHALSQNFDVFVLDPLRRLCDLSGINRYGTLIEMPECRDFITQSPVSRYLAADFDKAKSLSMRFVRKLPTESGALKSGVDDFVQAIYHVEQSEEGTIGLSIDFQQYFLPPMDAPDCRTRPYPKFVERSLDYYQGEFSEWLSRLHTSMEKVS